MFLYDENIFFIFSSFAKIIWAHCLSHCGSHIVGVTLWDGTCDITALPLTVDCWLGPDIKSSYDALVTSSNVKFEPNLVDITPIITSLVLSLNPLFDGAYRTVLSFDVSLPATSVQLSLAPVEPYSST